jgi:hypothetical protein
MLDELGFRTTWVRQRAVLKLAIHELRRVEQRAGGAESARAAGHVAVRVGPARERGRPRRGGRRRVRALRRPRAARRVTAYSCFGNDRPLAVYSKNGNNSPLFVLRGSTSSTFEARGEGYEASVRFRMLCPRRRPSCIFLAPLYPSPSLPRLASLAMPHHITRSANASH